ncbi:hypothetical protein V6N00_13890 [Tersicoccus sp. MR15.9]|uniref:hypothetical protein n=1 Tax=Tersicoccus mangrovi TaxID=3121635 RepID=UPI002FE6A386
MNGWQIFGIIVLVIVVLIAGLIGYAYLDDQKRKRREALLSPTDLARWKAYRAYAIKTVNAVTDSKTDREVLERKLAEARGLIPAASAITSGGTVRVFPSHVVIDGVEHPLTPAFSAAVDGDGAVAVKSRTTATRVITGAVVAGPAGAIVGAVAKKNQVVDSRTTYLTISDGQKVMVLVGGAQSGQALRHVAATINTLAPNSADRWVQRSARIAEVEQQLAAFDQSAGSPNAAKQQYQQLKGAKLILNRDGTLTYTGAPGAEPWMAGPR